MAIPPNKNPFTKIQLDQIQSSLQKTNPSLAALLNRSGILNTPAYPNNPKKLVMIIPNKPSIDPQAVAPANIDISSSAVASHKECFDSEDQLASAFAIPHASPPGQPAEVFRPLGTGPFPEDTSAHDDFITSVLGILDEGNPQMESSADRCEINSTDQDDLFEFSASEISSIVNTDSIYTVLHEVSSSEQLGHLLLLVIQNLSALNEKNHIYRDHVIKYLPSNIQLMISDYGQLELVFINDKFHKKSQPAENEEDKKFLDYLKICEKPNGSSFYLDKRFLSYIAGIILKKFTPNPTSVFNSEQQELASLFGNAIKFLTRANCAQGAPLNPKAINCLGHFGELSSSDSPYYLSQAISIFLNGDPNARITPKKIQQFLTAFYKLINAEHKEPAAKKTRRS